MPLIEVVCAFEKKDKQVNAESKNRWKVFRRTGYGGIREKFPVFMRRKIQIIILLLKYIRN